MLTDEEIDDIAEQYAINPGDAQEALWESEGLEAYGPGDLTCGEFLARKRKAKTALANHVGELLELIEAMHQQSQADRRLLRAFRAVTKHLAGKADLDLTNPDDLHVLHSWAILEKETRWAEPETTTTTP